MAGRLGPRAQLDRLQGRRELTDAAPRFLARGDLERVLPMREAVREVARAYRALARGEVEQPERTATPIPGGTFLSMPVAGAGGFGAKLISVVEGNPARGRPAIQGVFCLFDGATGAPRALVDGAALTAWRTGAAGGVGTDVLAPRDARVAAVLGAGAQGRTQALALDAVRELDELRIWSRTRARAEALAAELAGTVRARVVVADDPRAAARGAQVVTCATPATSPLLEPRDLDPVAHVNLIGSFRREMRELVLDAELCAGLVVDRREAAFAEAGELIEAVEAGLLDPSAPPEIGTLLDAPPADGARAPRTVFQSVGLGVQDLFVAAAAVAAAG